VIETLLTHALAVSQTKEKLLYMATHILHNSNDTFLPYLYVKSIRGENKDYFGLQGLFIDFSI
jgi:hypothetical protein